MSEYFKDGEDLGYFQEGLNEAYMPETNGYPCIQEAQEIRALCKMMFYQGALAVNPNLTSEQLKELFENQKFDLGLE